MKSSNSKGCNQKCNCGTGTEKRGRPRLLSLQEVVQEYGATMWFWRSRIWERELPVVQVGRKQFLDAADIDDFVNRNKRLA